MAGRKDVSAREAEVRAALAGGPSWADAVLLRARARLTRDQAALEEAADRFERVGAAYEVARTRGLRMDRGAGTTGSDIPLKPL